MKFKSAIIVVLWILCAVSASYGTEKQKPEAPGIQNGPSAFLPSDSFEFPPVMEGNPVIHEFPIQNRGTEALKIKKVRTGCGCSVASYTKEAIPPGGEGVVKIRIKTNGYGGKKIHKGATVFTNDKKNPKLSLILSGIVERVAAITPRVIRLRGAAGQPVISSVTITPDPKYPFKILGTKARSGRNIKFRLEELKDTQETRYRLTVENLKKEKGRYSDMVFLKTDSSVRPELQIAVYGIISDSNPEAKN